MKRLGAARTVAGVAGAGATIAALMAWPTYAQPPVHSAGVRSAQANDDGPPPAGEAPPAPGAGCPGGPGGPCPQGKAVGPALHDLLQQLNLTAEQQASITATLQADRAAMEKLHAEIQQLQKQTRAEVDSVLTNDQISQLQTLETQLCKAASSGSSGHGGGGSHSRH